MNQTNREIDPLQYPTLAKYVPTMVWTSVEKLQERYPDMTEEQCLLTLEMDFEQIELMSKG